MSTRNLKSVQGATRRNASAAIAKEVRERAEALSAEQKALDTAKANADIAHAAEIQSINDERAPLDEERGQILAILGVPEKPKKDKTDKDDDSKKKDKGDEPKSDDTEPESKSKKRIDELEERIDKRTPKEKTPEPTVAPATEGAEALNLPAPTVPPQRRSFRVVVVTFFHNLGWGWAAWTLAVIFGFIALLWLLLGYDGFFPTRPDALRVIGVIAITFFSFFIGGTIGSAFDRNKRTNAATVVATVTEDAPATPAPPVAS